MEIKLALKVNDKDNVATIFCQWHYRWYRS